MPLLSRLAVQAARAYGALSFGDKNAVPASYLVVAGGGGGGKSYGGGGGAGGYLTSTATLSTLVTYSITVGAGAAGSTSVSLRGAQGSNSVLSGTGLTTVTSTGGGGGGSAPDGAGEIIGGTGGSGGGGAANSTGGTNITAGGAGNTPSTSPSQGNNGGSGITDSVSYRGAGGGGGSSAVGVNGSASAGGNGGAGTASSISGSSVTYAGGGGGGAAAITAGTGGAGGGGNGSTTTGTAGTANTGGGGGGGGSGNGSAGGSGIVIISYTSATPKFVGGTLTTSGGNQIHTFTSSGTLSPLTPVTASYLVVAGGGGGGVFYGGGGGAGGLLTSSTTLYSGATYVVTVGAGGALSVGTGRGTSGGNSVISGTGLTTVTSTGGGGGGGSSGAPQSGGNGGSGGGGGGSGSGGAGGTGISGQGFAGGTTATGYSGGGGGASAVGGNAVASVNAGVGGAGSSSSISGTSTTYAGGGGGNGALGGAGGGGGQGAPNGVTNTGGGGQGDAGSGGSGVVIISYAGSQVFNGGLVTSSGGNTIHTFTATGALTPLTNNLNNSLRFRASASASLSRTPAITGNRQTFTYSFWMKRGILGTLQRFFGVSDNATGDFIFQWTTSNTLEIYDNGPAGTSVITTQVFRDPSAWYHIVIVYDTTNATTANRVRVYVNGNQVTAFGTAVYPAQNTNSFNNQAGILTQIGIWPSGSQYYDGYMADINFIDGQALEPYYFGNNDANGVWKPIKYTGTYGTNGYYLTFGNTTSTTTIGYDTSGNNNNFTSSGISLTAGVTYDAMTDVPTNTSATTANYATLNPVLQNSWWAAVNRGTIQNGNLTHASGGNTTAFGNFDFVANSGKWYYEVTCGATDSNNTIVIAAQSRSTFEVGYYQSGQRQINGATPTSYGSSWTSGDVIGVAIDVPNNTITFYKNNVSQGAITNTFPTGQPVYGGSYYNSTSGDYNYNFGQRPFTYTPPTGYVALNTFNLPTPTILQGNKYMDATLYSGSGSSQVIVNNAQFKPDLAWIKSRAGTSGNSYNLLYDSIRGAGKFVSSNTTNAEAGNSGDLLGSFNSNGFSVNNTLLGASNPSADGSGTTFVGWQWQAGQGSTSSNTSGSITSTVSVNTTAGFSVITWSGNSTSGATIGHGLGVAPKMFIVKVRNRDEGWVVGHTSIGWSNFLQLNNTNASASSAFPFNNTAPSSTLITLGSGSGTNGSTYNYVGYAWAEIAGFSKFGSYTGNGSTDGPFIYLGFRPKFVLIKRTDSSTSGNWSLLDSSINTYNEAQKILTPNTADSESTQNYLDLLSNGFKVRYAAANQQINTNGGSYIYAAFAENPFKNSNAR